MKCTDWGFVHKTKLLSLFTTIKYHLKWVKMLLQIQIYIQGHHRNGVKFSPKFCFKSKYIFKAIIWIEWNIVSNQSMSELFILKQEIVSSCYRWQYIAAEITTVLRWWRNCILNILQPHWKFWQNQLFLFFLWFLNFPHGRWALYE